MYFTPKKQKKEISVWQLAPAINQCAKAYILWLSSIIATNIVSHIKFVHDRSFLFELNCHFFVLVWIDIDFDLLLHITMLSGILQIGSAEEWTLCYIKMCVLYKYSRKAERGLEDGRKTSCWKKAHVGLEIGASINTPSLANFFFFQLINKTKKVETF